MVSSLYKIGSKGATLYRMTQAGLPVPACFYVSAEDISSIEVGEIEEALQRLGTNSVAVRSSAVEEDATAASFAGIYTTRLNVLGAAGVKRALEEVRDSVFSTTAAAYRQMRGITSAPRIAAVVQQFISAESAGVMFTADPLGGSQSIIVEGCWGLGEALVSGAVTPDRWIFSREGTRMSSTVADKDIQVIADASGGTRQIEVDPAYRRRACLDLDQLHRLVKLAIECERLFASPQDIEWAIASNQVWLLQSRPIVGRA
jgi:pyruvate,water dikinase